MEIYLKNFQETGLVSDGVAFLEYCRKEKLFEIGLAVGTYMLEIFSNNSFLLSAIALLAYEAQDYAQCLKLLRQVHLFVNINLDENIQNIESKCIEKLKGTLSSYTASNITPNPNGLITFSITTCKRYDLFERTMNSFLTACTDIRLIKEWICVDDNSSEEDRTKMKTNYPFFTFVFKDAANKGHPRSMNIIRNRVQTPYLFHMEDDWEFFFKDNYLTRCLEVLTQSPNIGQCLLNKNYRETEKDGCIIGGTKALTERGNIFFIHDYCKTDEEKKLFIDKYGNGVNCNYWPHFSFRPSMIKTSVFQKLGQFNETTFHFEMNYAERYVKEKIISTFLPSISCIHIGRLTSERFDETKENAYTLNEQPQLGPLKEKSSLPPTFIINMESRADRWDNISRKEEISFLRAKRFCAIDGRKLQPNERLQCIFEYNDYNMRQGMVGCALSHIQLLINLVNSNQEYYLILEDDIEFTNDFKNKFLKLLENLPKDWDLCLLSYHLWKQFRTEDFLNRNENPVLIKWATNESLNYSMGGTGAYLISRKGAETLLNFIDKHSMTNGIDTMQQKSADIMDVYYCKPQLIFSECCDIGNNIDTDIQNNFKTLSMPLSERIKNELCYLENTFKTTVNILNINETKEAILNTDYNSIIVCNSFHTDFLSCVHPFYNRRNFFVAVPTRFGNIDKNKTGSRLKNKENKFDISEALIQASNTVYISLSDGKHVSEILKQKYKNNPEFPFDTISNITLKTCINLIEQTLTKNIHDLLFSLLEQGHTSGQSFNGQPMFHNNEFNIDFPHEKIEELKIIYFNRFTALKNSIMNNDKIVFIHASRYEKENESDFQLLLNIVSKYNSNVELVSINSLSSTADFRIKTFFISFPENLRTKEWTNEKIMYDQRQFRHDLEKIIMML